MKYLWCSMLCDLLCFDKHFNLVINNCRPAGMFLLFHIKISTSELWHHLYKTAHFLGTFSFPPLEKCYKLVPTQYFTFEIQIFFWAWTLELVVYYTELSTVKEQNYFENQYSKSSFYLGLCNENGLDHHVNLFG